MTDSLTFINIGNNTYEKILQLGDVNIVRLQLFDESNLNTISDIFEKATTTKNHKLENTQKIGTLINVTLKKEFIKKVKVNSIFYNIDFLKNDPSSGQMTFFIFK